MHPIPKWDKTAREGLSELIARLLQFLTAIMPRIGPLRLAGGYRVVLLDAP